MSRPHPDFPSPEEGLHLHLRLCDLDSVAPAEVCKAYLVPLLAWLAATRPGTDPDALLTAAHEALVSYFQQPCRYQPQRADLGTYLRMATRGDLANVLRGEARHQRRRTPWNVVEEDPDAGNLSGREEEPAALLERAEQAEAQRAWLDRLAEGCTAEERRVLELLLQGEHATAAHARALGCTDLPPAEQERAVKRVKDRLKKRLERGGGKHV